MSKGKRGGWRGGGRPKGSLSQSTLDLMKAKQLMNKLILRDIYPIVNSQLKRAKGEIYSLDDVEIIKTKDGEVLQKNAVVYKQAPDIAAAKLLLEYVFGKPKETMDLTVNNPDAVNSIDNLSANIKRILELKQVVIPTQNVQPIKTEPVQTIAEPVKEPVKENIEPVKVVTIDPKAILDNQQ